MSKVLQKHKDRALDLLKKLPQGMYYDELRRQSRLVKEAMDNVIGELKREGLIVVHGRRFFAATVWNRRYKNAEAKRPVKEIHRAAYGSKKSVEPYPTRGGVERFDYKVIFLKALRDTHKEDPAVVEDIESVIEDFERLVMERELKGAA